MQSTDHGRAAAEALGVLGAALPNGAYPEKNNAANNFGGILPYPNSSPFGFAGAYYYGTVAYHW